ncbi:MAG: hypothetical protein J6T10_08375 [Methanobrevibacter sp.]|nr:hypothetical protein [Methanobrevibacter sp.]
MNDNKTPSIIRWTKSDYGKLSYAVRMFNKKVRELESLDKNVLPDEFNYQELKDTIYSRKELNRVLKSLRKFSNNESQQKAIKLEGGEEITRWEYSELKKAQKRAISTIQEKARGIVESDTNVIGDLEFKQLMRTKESIEDLFNRLGSEFKRTAKRTLSWGKNDYELWRAQIYRDNYMNKVLIHMSEYDNYELLVKKLNSIENPIKFYEYVQRSTVLQDLFLFYRDKATAQTYGGFTSNQEAFDYGIFEQLGIPRPKVATKRRKQFKK